jgi:hypothetical protein
MPPPVKTKFAFDTNQFIDLAADVPITVDCHREARRREHLVCVTFTVLNELDTLHYHSPDDERRKLAGRALDQIPHWANIVLAETDSRITRDFARLLIRKGWLPAEEMNDGRIVAEAALAAIPIVVSNDHHLLDIPAERLLESLLDLSLNPVVILHPRQLLARW